MVMLKSSCKVVFQGYWNSCRDFPHCAMSRCFPFPPPGYERKPTTDIDLLKKEKRKEKKHKKDKKDKEKREGKDKREERSDGKHKEKKEKKDKHRDKKKDKEKRVDGQFSHKQKDSSSSQKESSLQLQNGEHREQLKENCSTSDDKKSRGQNSKNEDIDSSKFVQELSRRIRDDEKRTGTLQFPVESRKVSVDRRVEDKGKIWDKEFHEKQGVKQNNKDRTNGEKVKEKTELLDNKKKYMKNSLSTHSPNVGIPCAAGDIKKRKDIGTNGFSHEIEPRPNKMARPTTILTENGRKEDFLENPGPSQPGKQGPSQPGSFKVDSKERKYNGVIASQAMSIFPKQPPVPTKPTPIRSPPVSTNHIAATQPPPYKHIAATVPPPAPPLPNSKKKRPAEPPVRPPHPDTKYLKQILTVPNLDQWCGLEDDQEWLLSRKVDTHFTKTIGDDSLQDNKGIDEVWSEAKYLELVNICALPYVIPL